MSYDESRPPPVRPEPIIQRPPPPSPRRLRAAREARVRHIRRRVTGLTAAVFLLLWGVIFARLVEGHDPALSRTAASRAGSTTAVAHVRGGAAERAAARRRGEEARAQARDQARAQARDRARARARRRARAAARAAAQAANTAAAPPPVQAAPVAPPPVQAAPVAPPTVQAAPPAPAPAPATTRGS